MRTEVKIGIAVAVFLAAVAGFYFLMGYLGSDEPQDESETAQAPNAGGPSAVSPVPVEPAPLTRAPGDLIPSEELGPPPAPAPGEEVAVRDPEEPGESLRIPVDGPPSLPEIEPLPSGVEPVLPEVEPVEPVERTRVEPESPAEGDPLRLPGWAESLPPEVEPISSEPVTPTGTEGWREYVVEKGDAGFWTVSVKMYGTGEHYRRIAEANPGLDSTRLRPGQRLRIPPLPTTGAERVSTPRASVPPTATASGTYVVRAGDAGFWGVAKSVYGEGSLWRAIAEANPGVDSETLQPGQTLVIPPKPRARVTSPVSPETPPVGGGRTYTVKAGDAGFWTVSARMYGTGAYWRAVAEANPGVESAALRPGQVLVVPELTEEMKRRYAGAAAPGTPREPMPIPEEIPGRPPRPIFD